MNDDDAIDHWDQVATCILPLLYYTVLISSAQSSVPVNQSLNYVLDRCFHVVALLENSFPFHLLSSRDAVLISQ